MGEKKHLFGSTEKSDFILNMTEQGTKKLCGIYCMIAMLIVALAAIPYYLTKDIVDYVSTETGFEVTHYLSEKLVFLVSTLFIAAGLIGFLIFLVGHIKQEVIIKNNKALLWFAGYYSQRDLDPLCRQHNVRILRLFRQIGGSAFNSGLSGIFRNGYDSYRG